MPLTVVRRRAGRTAAVLTALAFIGLGSNFVVESGSDVSVALEQEGPVDGEKAYLTRCMSCHQMNGEGVPGVFPPLDGSEWVTGDKGRLARIILHGVTGPIEVAGAMYQSAMPPWGAFIEDDEIAAIASYVRSSWSNDAEPLTEAEVAAVRAATADRKAPFTAEELMKEENLGVPE